MHAVATWQVGKLNLKFQDKKTGDIKDVGKTRPEVILRQLSTKPGEVIEAFSRLSPWTSVSPLLRLNNSP